MNSRGFEMSFAWIFSVIVGGVVLFLAIYGTTQLIDAERTVQDTEVAQQFGTLLTQVESSLESSARPGNITFSSQTRITNECSSLGIYGLQKLSIATRSGLGSPWQEAGLPSQSPSRYVFSASTVEGKTFSTYTRPLEMPFRIGTAIVLWSEPYCFVAPPGEVEDEIAGLHFGNATLLAVDSARLCPPKSTVVCFSSAGLSSEKCSVKVDLASQRVVKNGVTLYYEPPFLYAAIIADPGIYECQVKRLFKRGAELAQLYQGKSEFIASHSPQQCSAGMQAELGQYAALAKNMTSRRLSDLSSLAQNLGKENEQLSCPLWKERST